MVVAHCSGVEGHNLVIRPIRIDEAGRGELVIDDVYPGGVNPMPFEPGTVVAEIMTSRTYHQWPLTQKCQVIGDVPSHSTAHFTHRVDQKAD